MFQGKAIIEFTILALHHSFIIFAFPPSFTLLFILQQLKKEHDETTPGPLSCFLLVLVRGTDSKSECASLPKSLEL